MNITINQRLDKHQFKQLEHFLITIIHQNQKIMATQAEIVAKLQAQKVTIDQIASDVSATPTTGDATPELEAAANDLGTSIDALRSKVPTVPVP